MKLVPFIVIFFSLSLSGFAHGQRLNLELDHKKLIFQGTIERDFLKQLNTFLVQKYYEAVRSGSVVRKTKLQRLQNQRMLNPIIARILAYEALEEEKRDLALEILKYIVQLDIQMIIIDSQGGILQEIIPLNIIVEELDLRVHVPSKGICASACSFFFHHSSKRTMGEEAELMYHKNELIIPYGWGLWRVCETSHDSNSFCSRSPSMITVLREYEEFLASLPGPIFQAVEAGEDRYVKRSEAKLLGILTE
jgi:hypothetical protein